MLGHLHLEAGLQHVPRQIGEQAALTGQRDPLRASPVDRRSAHSRIDAGADAGTSSPPTGPAGPSPRSCCVISVLPPAAGP
jgi:hypothetical protein